MGEKPTGPIYIDMAEALMGLPVRALVHLANVALNTMDARTLGEVLFDVGLRGELVLRKDDNG